MLLTRPFETVTPTVDGDVLGVLSAADQWFPLSHIHALVNDRSRSGIRKALQRLVEQGIVLRQQLGSQFAYRLNRDHLAAPAVIELAHLYATYLNQLRSLVQGWPAEPAFAALFGSAARGDMRTDSDIDIFLVRPHAAEHDPARTVWDTNVSELQSASTRWTGNDTRVLEMGEADVARGLTGGDQVLLDIRSDGVPLAGSWAQIGAARHG